MLLPVGSKLRDHGAWGLGKISILLARADQAHRRGFRCGLLFGIIGFESEELLSVLILPICLGDAGNT